MARMIICFTLVISLVHILEAGVTELPDFRTDENELEIHDEETVKSIASEVEDTTKTSKEEFLQKPSDVEKTPNFTQSVEPIPLWNSETSPIFKVFRDFLFQPRDDLLGSSDTASETPFEAETREIFKIIEEATTMIMEAHDLETATEVQKVPQISAFEKRQGSSVDTIQDKIRLNPIPSTSKRQSDVNLAVNMTTSCSNCYDALQSCVRKCFVANNCHDVQREARRCPPIPNRLCNPFTPWSPVDQCKEHGDCKSPLLCCNDGCVKKCSQGIWKP